MIWFCCGYFLALLTAFLAVIIMKGMIRHMNPEKPSEAKIEVDSEELRKIQKQKEEWDNMMNYSGMR